MRYDVTWCRSVQERSLRPFVHDHAPPQDLRGMSQCLDHFANEILTRVGLATVSPSHMENPFKMPSAHLQIRNNGYPTGELRKAWRTWVCESRLNNLNPWTIFTQNSSKCGAPSCGCADFSTVPVFNYLVFEAALWSWLLRTVQRE